MKKAFVLFFFLLFIFNRLLAQDVAPYHIQQFTTENGLPSNGIKGLEWDEKNDFLWIATEAGISRYNGRDFVNFTKQNTPGLFHERMAYAVKSISGEIFTADVGDNVLSVKENIIIGQKYNEAKDVVGFKKRFYLSIEGNVLRSKLLAFILQSKDPVWSNVLQLTDTSILIVINNQNFYYITENAVEPIHITIPAMYGAPVLINGQLFVTDNEKRFYILKNNFQTFEPIKILSTEDKPISINKNNSLLYFENGMHLPILFSDNKAWLLDYKNDAIEATLICSVVPSYSFIRFAQYSEKNKILFIGTDSKGVIVVNKNSVTTMKNDNTDIGERNAYYAQIELSNGAVLTNEGHIIGATNHRPVALPIKGKFDYSTYKSGDSLLWFVQYNVKYGKNLLHRYDYRNGETKVYHKIPEVVSNFAMTTAEGKLYFSYYLGLGMISGDTLQYLFYPGKNKKQQSASYSMLEFSPGVLGVASCDGLILYNLAKQSTDTLLNLFGYCIRSLWKYKDYVFIGTYGKGYYVWKNGKIKAMPLDKNNFLLYTHCFIPDNNGFCWISSNRGLFKAQLSDLIDAYEHDRPSVYYHYFGKNDGMGITEMNGGCSPCALALKNNTLSFPTMDGLLWVNPDEAQPLLPEGKIYIDEFIAGDIKISPDSLAIKSIPFSKRDITIKLGFASWCNKENIYLEYLLDNSDKWIPVVLDNNAAIVLSNLDPGKHQLKLRKMNGFGINNYSYQNIQFNISTPWTRSWWFYILSSLLLLGSISLYLRFRTRQYKIRQREMEEQVNEKTKELKQQNEILEKSNSIKTRLISIISHDIITPLKFVTVAGKSLLEKKKLMSEELQQETVREMTNTSQELQLLSTNILNWIKYQNENRRMAKETFYLYKMVEQVMGILQSLAKQKGLLIQNNVKEEQLVYQFYEPLKILIYNLLTNAIHFTEKGTIDVNAIEQDGNIIISVKDEGVGMTAEQIERLMADEIVVTSANVDNKKGHGLGYLIIKDLLKTMDVTIRIESTKAKGTEVFIKMQKQSVNS